MPAAYFSEMHDGRGDTRGPYVRVADWIATLPREQVVDDDVLGDEARSVARGWAYRKAGLVT